MHTKKYIFQIILGLCPFFISAQSIERSVISPAGENLSTGNYELAYTVGETVAYTFVHGTQLTQGFHQVWAITTALKDVGSAEWNINVFPNPTTGILNVDSKESLSGKIINASGQFVSEHKIAAGNTSLDITTLPSGTYYLMLSHENDASVKTYSVIKLY